ncbi:MAG: primosomal protein N', partial [Bacilli bacterium]|nr:primosomal protein N' [Bacilli bacterium]
MNIRGDKMYADVLIQYGVKSLDRTFTYHVPSEFEGVIDKGMKVSVPFGKQNINGFVLNVHNNMPDASYEVKDITSIITKELKLNDELLELGHYIKSRTLCTLISAYQTMLPTSLKVQNNKETYDLTITYVRLNKDIKEIDEYIKSNKRGLKQNELLEALKRGRILKKDIKSKSSLNRLVELDLITYEYENVYRINKNALNNTKPLLSDEQRHACDIIKKNIDEYNTYLLHGITGSGKTEVYMKLCEDVIENGKCIIMLVPEISLTTQIVHRFYNRFGSDVAIFHSNLSEGEKFDEYKKIMKGEVHIVVGTRSAIFTPIKNLGLVIIDEEHSSNYKQDNNPRYHALDVAKWRCEYHKCPLVLGSATPSLESMARAGKDVYKYISLTKRIGESKLPTMEIVDMAPEFKKRNMVLSDKLQLEIMATLERHEQVMLLLNRRGYSTIINCQSCGFTYKCPHCDITLTYHKSSNHLRCHYCGYTVIKSDICPECGEKAIRDFGLGTEKVEQTLRELYPSYNIVRMDADTTSKKGAHENIIKGIERGEYDIIVGTQMISKGLDFPKVTLVGIINADESLNIPDFRSGENTFSLLSQVSGRAGRADLPGKVIIQTFNSDNKTLNYVLKNDYMGNYNYEMDIRRKLKYPPYYYLVLLRVTSKSYEMASKESIKVANYIRSNMKNETICLGPTTANMFKINNIFRFQIIVKYRRAYNLFELIEDIDKQYINNK